MARETRRVRWPGAFLLAAFAGLSLPGSACVQTLVIGGDLTPDAGEDRRDTAPPKVDSEPGLDAAGEGDTNAGCPDGEAPVKGICQPVIPPCSPMQPDGSCPSGLSCEMGKCTKPPPPPCSPMDPMGACPSGQFCEMGKCVPLGPCNPMGPDGGGCPPGQLCTPGAKCQPDPCLMSICKPLICCPVLDKTGTFIAECVSGMKCP